VGGLFSPDDPTGAFLALTRFAQGYDYGGHNDISAHYKEAAFQEVIGRYLAFDRYTSSMAGTLAQNIGLDAPEPGMEEAVGQWAKLFEFTVNSAEITTTDLDEAAAGELAAIVEITVTRHVHITTDNLSSALAARAAAYPGGIEAIVAEGEDFFVGWFQDETVSLFSDPSAALFTDTAPQTVTIEMAKDDEDGWVFDTLLGAVQRYFVEIDADITMDMSYFQREGGLTGSGEPTELEGVWRRIALPSETIEFRGDQFQWVWGPKVIASGAFSIEGNRVILHGMGGVDYDYEINDDILIFNTERDDPEYKRE
jgi:hypothetical protein